MGEYEYDGDRLLLGPFGIMIGERPLPDSLGIMIGERLLRVPLAIMIGRGLLLRRVMLLAGERLLRDSQTILTGERLLEREFKVYLTGERGWDLVERRGEYECLLEPGATKMGESSPRAPRGGIENSVYSYNGENGSDSDVPSLLESGESNLIGDLEDPILALRRRGEALWTGDRLRDAQEDILLGDRERLRRNLGTMGERERKRLRGDVRRYSLYPCFSESANASSADVTELANEYVVPNLSIRALVSGVE
ncbi:5744_t:CDS:2, partial [Acaulospora colombiana]